MQVRCSPYAMITPPIQNKEEINEDYIKNNCVESGDGTNNARCTTQKSFDIGQITIGTGHTSPNP
jgi:hypothetical protein